MPKQELQSTHTVSALLLAGLYSNVARLDPPKSATEKQPLLSAGSEQIKLHPGRWPQIRSPPGVAWKTSRGRVVSATVQAQK